MMTYQCKSYYFRKLKMKTFAEDLYGKSQAVRREFGSKACEIENTDLSDKYQKKLFDSMTRWHANGHMTQENWISCFDNIKGRLDVKGQMEPMKSDFKNFLHSKFSVTSLTKGFSLTEMFSFLEEDIKQLYDEKLKARDLDQGEFNLSKIWEGVAAEDGTFYQKVFLPSAIFFTYLEKHKGCGERKDLMQDCFTVGAGSKREDLFPEVTGLCRECATDEYKNFSELDIETFNKKVFKLQVSNNFKCNYYRAQSDESDADEDTQCGIDRWFNPFDSSDEEITEMIETVRSILDIEWEQEQEQSWYTCNMCTKQFSREEFLKYHKDWFHKTSNETAVIGVTCPEPEELILSFSCEPGPSKIKEPIKTSRPKRKLYDQEYPNDLCKKVLRSRK